MKAMATMQKMSILKINFFEAYTAWFDVIKIINNAKTTTTTDSKAAPVKAVKGLTADEVREANEIFN